jgi:uncharacterized small protein (DUF1192 family)
VSLTALTIAAASSSLGEEETAMAIFDEDAPKKKVVHEIGEDLSKLSLDELAERVEILKAEIVRLEEAAAAKRASASAAQTFFKR